MVTRVVIWTETAIRQRRHTFEYWNDRNKSKAYSRRLQAAIRERIDHLKAHPEMGRETELEGIRVISLGHYSIIYRSEKERILILAFWDNRRDPKKLLQSINEA